MRVGEPHDAIARLTVLQSLRASVDLQMMATMRGWSFQPATKNGLLVVSEQEIVSVMKDAERSLRRCVIPR